MKEVPIKKPIPVIHCRATVNTGTGARGCRIASVRIGTQDECDVYVCPDQHITRIRVGEPRAEYHE